MLGWFKKKFKKKDDEAAVSPAYLKIPVAPRTFGTDIKPDEADTPATTETATVTPPESIQPEAEPAPPLDEVTTVPDESPEDRETETVTEVQVEPEPEIDTSQVTEREEPELLEATELPVPPSPHGPVEPEPAEEPELPKAVETTTDESEAISAKIVEEATTDTLETLDRGETIAAEADLPPAPAIEDEIIKSQKIPVAPRITPVQQEESKAVPKTKPFLSRLSERLSRTRETFTYQLDTLFLGKKEIDAELLDDLEELLITADLGVSTTQEVLDYARKKVKRNELSDPNSLKQVLKEKIKSFIVDYQEDAELVMPDEGPFVIMVVGVNGVGKTTTIGKIAHKFLQSEQSVLLVAADTFRAAAISQLKIWGERNNIPVIAKNEGDDPSSVVYDALAHAKAKHYDVVLVDTAGRLHTQANLMEELKKIKRVMNKQLSGSPHEVMLVIDATTGQNGISQAKLFDAAVDLTGITLTKLDGTAKGGIVANICKELKTPIRFIGVGEQIEDLRDFDPDEFVEALFQSTDHPTE